jgi:hypothetical protein
MFVVSPQALRLPWGPWVNDIRNAVRHALGGFGTAALTFRRGAAAVAAPTRSPPQLILRFWSVVAICWGYCSLYTHVRGAAWYIIQAKPPRISSSTHLAAFPSP